MDCTRAQVLMNSCIHEYPQNLDQKGFPSLLCQYLIHYLLLHFFMQHSCPYVKEAPGEKTRNSPAGTTSGINVNVNDIASEYRDKCKKTSPTTPNLEGCCLAAQDALSKFVDGRYLSRLGFTLLKLASIRCNWE